MKIKVKYILVGLILVILAIIGIILIYKKNVKKSSKEILTETIETEKQYTEFDDFNELGLYVAKKNGDWSNFHLSEKFRSKYNEKDGIFGDMQFDKVEYKPYHDGKYPFEDHYYLVVTQGKKKTAYIFSMVSSTDGYDIVWGDIIELTDENGNDLDARISINDNNFNTSFYLLSRGGTDEESIAVTPHFHKKYPYFLDLFIHYSPLTFNHIEFVSEKSSWEKKEAYFIVDSTLECKKRNYLVEFTLDDKGYLDDAVVHKVNEEEYEGDSNNRSVKLLYQNSNWDNLKITDNYRTKYNNNSYNPDIADLDIDYQTEEEYVEEGNYNEYLRRYRMKDGQYSIYYVKYISAIDDYEYLDDILCEKLEYGNISLEDAKTRFLSDKN